MEAIVIPVLQTSLNLPGLIQACQEMQQPNPAAAPDQRNLKGLPHTVAVIDEIQKKPYLTHSILSLGYLIACWPDDMDMVLSHTGGMPHLYHNGPERFQCVIVSGTINQWIDACRRACVKEAEHTVRFVFNRVYWDLESKIGLKMDRTDNQDQTFLLEHK